jgi:SAM-dependent methyltransferase
LQLRKIQESQQGDKMSGSETAKVRSILAPYCLGDGIDIGYGGDPIVPNAICFDLPHSYGPVGNHPQHLHGDARSLPFKNETLDYAYSSHLIEDFSYNDQVVLLYEWTRVLRIGGILLLCAPDQQKYLVYNRAHGQMGTINQAHKEADYSLATFKERVWSRMAAMSVVREWDNVGDYCWCFAATRRA